MKLHYAEEITLIMCEDCWNLIIEENSQESKRVSYCSECAARGCSHEM